MIIDGTDNIDLRIQGQGFGIELRRGRFDAVIDGERVGSLEWQETIEVPIEPGHHTVQIRRAATPAA